MCQLRLKFSIKSSTHYLRFLRDLILSIGETETKPDHKTLSSCALALVEAVNNAIFHAHNNMHDLWIDIDIKIEDKFIEMRVADRGPGFDLPEFRVPAIDHIHGRGLFIIESLMHEVEYTRGSRNVLRMVYRV